MAVTCSQNHSYLFLFYFILFPALVHKINLISFYFIHFIFCTCSQIQSWVDFINPFMLYAKLLHSPLYFYTSKSFSIFGQRAKMILCSAKCFHEIDPWSLSISDMLFSASVLSYQGEDNNFVIAKQSFAGANLSCSVEDLIPGVSVKTSVQGATYWNNKLIVFSNSSEGSFAQSFDTIEKV